MKKLLTILILTLNLVSIAGASTKKIETYEDLVKKEEEARQVEQDSFEKESKDTYDEDRKKEEELERKEIEKEEKEREIERENRHIEVKDDAGYDQNNMDKVREAGHRAWDKLQDGFDRGNE